MTTYIIEPPYKKPIVEKVEVFDWDVIRSPIACERRVTHTLVNVDGHISFRLNDSPNGQSIPTLSDSMKCLVYMSDGTIARSTMTNVGALLDQLGQEWSDPT